MHAERHRSEHTSQIAAANKMLQLGRNGNGQDVSQEPHRHAARPRGPHQGSKGDGAGWIFPRSEGAVREVAAGPDVRRMGGGEEREGHEFRRIAVGREIRKEGRVTLAEEGEGEEQWRGGRGHERPAGTAGGRGRGGFSGAAGGADFGRVQGSGGGGEAGSGLLPRHGHHLWPNAARNGAGDGRIDQARWEPHSILSKRDGGQGAPSHASSSFACPIT